jgi:hypothetical protein
VTVNCWPPARDTAPQPIWCAAVLAARQLHAQTQAALGHLDASCATWTLFLDDYEQASSARGDEHFETMRARVRGFRSSPVVPDLQARAHAVAVGKGVAA